MKKPLIDTVTWLAAFDGGKALIWRNEGFDDQPNLKLVETLGIDNPPDRDQGEDRPGRFPDPAHGRSAVSETDFHQQAKERFVDEVVEYLNKACAEKKFDRLVVMAPDKALGEARSQFSDDLAECLIEEPVDVINEPVDKIEKRLAGLLTA
ncbi:host attachment family protein [Maricaulis sp.]|uniref:host attachment family protein n=1 Tax=Maricaulis sp. TaxID=1486257 RepID=UPI001B0D30AF|nr:host attachment family protein [Maricaulis sp.]MBO6765524.1 host attachment protein [Maricaulis sp.]